MLPFMQCIHWIYTLNVYTDIYTMHALNAYADVYTLRTLTAYADIYATDALNVLYLYLPPVYIFQAFIA